MAFATWLLDTLRGEGLHVVEMDGWRTRQTRNGFEPRGVVCHHTATSSTVVDANVRNLLRDGRSDLPGPLCQMGLERDGTFVLIAAGRGNHNGYDPNWGNDAFGIEAYNDGVGEPWPPAQLDAYRRGVAAICRRQGWGTDRVKAHRETTVGKSDPKGIDIDLFRSDVQALIQSPGDDPDMTPAEFVDLMKNDPTLDGIFKDKVRQALTPASGLPAGADEVGDVPVYTLEAARLTFNAVAALGEQVAKIDGVDHTALVAALAPLVALARKLEE